jgi:hypothetical protein
MHPWAFEDLAPGFRLSADLAPRPRSGAAFSANQPRMPLRHAECCTQRRDCIMKPSEIREELIAQHEGLRARVGTARSAAAKWARGEVSRSHVRDALAELADAVREHNLREERALGELVRSIDAGGSALEGIMNDEHIDEHREMFDTLIHVSQTQDPGEGGRGLEKFCARMLDHMTWEEKAFLNATVLRDD